MRAPIDFKKFYSNPYLLTVPIIATNATSIYYAVSNFNSISSIEKNYLTRVSLIKPTNTTNIGGQSIDFSKDDVIKQKLQEDQYRLSNFYSRFSSKPATVNSYFETNDGLNLFVHFRTKSSEKNLNQVWLDNVQLNQLSIDRYGVEYDDKGEKKASSQPSLHEIVKWSDIDISNMKYHSASLPYFSFNFFNRDIPKTEVDILVNEEESKYQVEEGTSKDWFVWLDKDLLAIRLNYVLTTYIFNQSAAKSQSYITSLLGSSGSSQSEEQKAKQQQIEANEKSLSSDEKVFASDYIETFFKTSETSTINWTDVVNKVTNSSDLHIKSADLNKIYNKFKSKNKSVAVFNRHLLTRISSGKTGNWRISLDLKKDNSAEFESRKIDKSTYGSQHQEKNRIRIFADADLNPNLDVKEIFDLLSNYSVKYFSADSTSLVSSNYFQGSTRGKELIHVLDVNRDNEFSLYKSNYLIPVILASIFLCGVAAYLIKVFKKPGGIFFAGTLSGLVNTLGTYFFLGSDLSLAGISAFIVGIFYSMFLSYYLLGFLKKLFDFEFLDKRNIWVAFKRGLILSSDLTLPLFVFSSFVSFLAPFHLREFGIVLSIFIIFSFISIVLVCNFIALKYAQQKFFKLGSQYKSIFRAEDWCLKICSSKCSNFYFCCGAGSVLALFLLSLVIFSIFGVNSFSLFKENYLLTFFLDKDAISSSSSFDQVKQELTDDKILELLPHAQVLSSGSGLKSFLVSGSVSYDGLKNLLSSKLSAGNYYLQKTDSFGDFQTILPTFWAIGFSSIIMSLYIFVRFKTKKLVIFLVNTFVSFLIFFSIVVLTRVTIFSNFFLAIFSFFALSIMYHMTLFNIDKISKIDYFSNLSIEVVNDIYRRLRHCLTWFLALSLLTFSEEIMLLNFYIFLAAITIHLISTFLYKSMSRGWNWITDRYFVTGENIIEEEHEERSLDVCDEEVILGINLAN